MEVESLLWKLTGFCDEQNPHCVCFKVVSNKEGSLSLKISLVKYAC